MRTILVLGMLALGRLLPAQTSSACQQILREYQVEHIARLIPDSSLDAVPIDTGDNQRNVVAFVVDSSGRVVPSSFRALVVASAPELEEAKGLLPRWRFTPATNGGRPVCQLTQTYLKRSSRTDKS